jgi:hypothetical protein
VILHALVDHSLAEHQVVETCATREEAERALRDVLTDEPDWAEHFEVVELELETTPN